jgi:hypothetical protein
MPPSSPNRRPNNLNNMPTGSEFNPTNNINNNINIANPVNSNNIRQNFEMNLRNNNLNLNTLMKNNEQYEMNLAINNNMISNNLNNNGYKDYYSQTQRSSMQNPMVLNADQFNNINNKSSKLGELTNGNKMISNDKLKDVIIYFI